MRLFTVSDLHTDHPENWKWLEHLSRQDYLDDTLIVAGDIADEIGRLRASLAQLSRRFRHVCFVPGNHDLWVIRSDLRSSFDKFRTVGQACRDAGVQTRACRVGSTLIVPLLGWYDYSFGPFNETLRDNWMDFKACHWDGHDDAAVSRAFDELNQQPDTRGARHIVSFSHFLPRIDLMPDGVPEQYRYLYPVLGSSRLERQVRRLGAQTHIYGHSHLNRRVTLEGVTYINNAFGYPSERHIANKALLYLGEL
ncbi:metallophosphoesterase [Pseudomonas chlororaphis subsp. aurantiaca]|uniref:metallophosphoesterase n=1 Tax=Pseudomonas chlororaphis TaxID=587753 RepID=UPI0027DB2B0F|nr:metallophosphoesterase [Pseudomonas chlororaphis]WMJ02935.1 metallophosphoesterase [Pseudomonas chlororaphis subsp. aurantiaca]